MLPTSTTAVETSARVTARPAPPPPRIFELRLSALLEHGCAGDLGEPDLLDSSEHARPLHVRERVVDAGDQGVALLEDHPEALPRARARELTDDLAVRYLHRRHVERGRKVDDEAVDLAVLQRGHGGVVRVVDGDRLTRLDVPHDVLVTRRPKLRAELVLAQAVDRAHRRDGLALEAHDRLVDEVVAGAEAQCL